MMARHWKKHPHVQDNSQTTGHTEDEGWRVAVKGEDGDLALMGEASSPRSSFGFLRRHWSGLGDHSTKNGGVEPTDGGVNSFSNDASDSLSSSIDALGLPQLELKGYAARTRQRLLTQELAAEIRELLPARLRLYDQWTLLYNLEQHGASLSTLYDHSRPKTDRRHGYVLIVRDMDGQVFGAYSNEHFHPTTEGRRFYGNGECFLWKSQVVGEEATLRFQAFPHTGMNDFDVYCTNRFLSMGGGDGHYGLWLDDNLDHGVSNRCLTYGNEPLSASRDDGKFKIQSIEVWRVG
jgi:hypothetical protein